jgi:hypothetical protein
VEFYRGLRSSDCNFDEDGNLSAVKRLSTTTILHGAISQKAIILSYWPPCKPEISHYNTDDGLTKTETPVIGQLSLM